MKNDYIDCSIANKIDRSKQALFAAKIRTLPMVLAVVFTHSNLLRIYYKKSSQKNIQKCIIEHVKTVYSQNHSSKNAVVEEHMSFSEYRRDALISLSGFAVMQILQKTAPATFLAMHVARKVFVLFIARNLITSGLKSIVYERQPNADTLTSTAVISSILAGKPESSLTLLALSNFAEMLTMFAADKARKHISSLLSLDQQYVWKIEENGHERKIRIEQIEPGDKIAVHLGEKICVDGKVIDGYASVDQASITGESIPVEKHVNATVYAGTVIQGGHLEILVEKVGDDTSLARIVHMVEDAQTRRAPVQNFADRMANMLVPISFLSAAVVYGATRDWQRVLNMLFIDFSCGLKLSTATAISAAIGKAAKRGILIKGGNYIETLAGIDTIVLDKTGTITIGQPQITAINKLDHISEKEIVLLAASAEMHSAHPLAIAIQQYVEKQGWETPDHLSSETIIARGMLAQVPNQIEFSGGTILVGSLKFMKEENVTGLDTFTYIESTPGLNVLYIARDGILLGLLTIHDPIRPAFKKAINQLRRQGIDEVVMITGDSQVVAEHVASAMDIDEYYAEALPADKANIVSKLQHRGHVLMVGDGINDAPALAFADIGVAMGGRRTDIAVESSDVTINSEDPLKLPEVVELGQQTMQLIRQNFTATITINTIAMLLGALGRITPLVAAIVHNAATIGVVINSSRILMPEKNIYQRSYRRR